MVDNIFVEATQIRNNILSCIKFVTFHCFIAELIIYFFFKNTNFYTTELDFIIYKVCLPTSINIIICTIAYLVYRSRSITHSTKNATISLCFALMLSSISIIHSAFMALWISPIIAVYLCIPFYRRSIHGAVLSIAICSVILSCHYQCRLNPEKTVSLIQNAIIVIMIDAVLDDIMHRLLRFNRSILKQTDHFYRSQVELERKIYFDFLTGVFSKEHILHIGQELLSIADSNNPVNIAIIDIDNFKSINDTYGHENGDVVLRALGKILQEKSQDGLLCGRFGGEEFIIIQKGKSEEECKDNLEHIRIEMSELKFNFTHKIITISGGSILVNEVSDFDTVLQEADSRLYKSKANGKNQFTY